MDYNEDTDTCQLNAASNVTYKLPNSAIDICLIYGIDENTDRCLKPLNFTEKLQSDSSALQVSIAFSYSVVCSMVKCCVCITIASVRETARI